MRLPIIGNGTRKNRRKLGVEANLDVEGIDEPANAILRYVIELLSR
jgi:hypothetical protein